MDFFAGQDQARRNTGLLVALFALAVLLLIAATNLLVLLVLTMMGVFEVTDSGVFAAVQHQITDWRLVTTISFGILSVISLATLLRMFQLSGGGAVIAEGMGGRLLSQGSDDQAERRLLNVVAEMAIAAGTPVPRVYLLEGETGINAFAAGFGAADAVIGVTRGTVDRLPRDELQGIIAHEFSHILNGDMRLNLRLIAVLHGILFLGQLGRIVLRSMRHSRRGKGAAPIALLGVGLVVVGAGGSLCGRLIKAAVSRQREYLADASAVQFTRNPSGIAAALKRIGSSLSAGRVDHPRAEESSHLFFADALLRSLRSPFATHPPLEDRIRRLDPAWRGEFSVPRAMPGTTDDTAGIASMATAVDTETDLVDHVASITEPMDTAAVSPLEAEAVIPLAEAVVPALLQQAAGNIMSAPALLCALLLDDNADARTAQLVLLAQQSGGRDEEAGQCYQRLQPLDDAAYLALAELSAPVLAGLPGPERSTLMTQLEQLFALQDDPGLRAWAIFRQARALLLTRPPPGPRYRRIGQLSRALEILLSALAHHGDLVETRWQPAIERASAELGVKTLRILEPGMTDLAALDTALARLARAFPLLKPRILKACVAVIQADDRVTGDEALMLQMIATVIDCPAPRLLQLQNADGETG